MRGILLPLELIITMWETWLKLLKSTLFYVNNFENFFIMIKSLKDDINPHQCIEKRKQFVKNM
jgi:hypothetical protein